jgi:hypothetical protein
MPLFTNASPPWYGTENTNAGASHVLTANNVYLTGIYLPATSVVTGIRFALAATAAGNVDVGIYDANGNLIVNKGSTSISGLANTNPTFSFASPVVLSAGRYLIALTPGAATDTFMTQVGLQSGLVQSWTATNTSTGTTSPTLPASTGTLVNSAQRFVINAVIQGGAP